MDCSRLWRIRKYHCLGPDSLACNTLLKSRATTTASQTTRLCKVANHDRIIRILLMIPIYCLISFLSYLFFEYALYWQVIRDCYEAFAIASFFNLLCFYTAPDLHQLKDHFRQVTPKNWVLPINWFQPCTGGKERGLFRIPRSGLTWFNVRSLHLVTDRYLQARSSGLVSSNTASSECSSPLFPSSRNSPRDTARSR
jgi:Organic solute transporter Ostalpha